jgi:hypothetical protein
MQPGGDGTVQQSTLTTGTFQATNFPSYNAGCLQIGIYPDP